MGQQDVRTEQEPHPLVPAGARQLAAMQEHREGRKESLVMGLFLGRSKLANINTDGKAEGGAIGSIPSRMFLGFAIRQRHDCQRGWTRGSQGLQQWRQVLITHELSLNTSWDESSRTLCPLQLC